MHATAGIHEAQRHVLLPIVDPRLRGDDPSCCEKPSQIPYYFFCLNRLVCAQALEMDSLFQPDAL